MLWLVVDTWWWGRHHPLQGTGSALLVVCLFVSSRCAIGMLIVGL